MEESDTLEELLHPDLQNTAVGDSNDLFLFVRYAESGDQALVRSIPAERVEYFAIRYGDRQKPFVRAILAENQRRKRSKEFWEKVSIAGLGALLALICAGIGKYLF